MPIRNTSNIFCFLFFKLLYCCSVTVVCIYPPTTPSIFNINKIIKSNKFQKQKKMDGQKKVFAPQSLPLMYFNYRKPCYLVPVTTAWNNSLWWKCHKTREALLWQKQLMQHWKWITEEASKPNACNICDADSENEGVF